MIRGGVRTLKMGIRSLLLHKLRSALTMLGLLFGVSSVIAMLAVGEGASYEAMEQIKAMGSTNLIVRSQKPAETEEISGGDEDDAFVYGLTYADAERVVASFPAAEHVVSVRETPRSLRRGIHWSSGIVVGTTKDYFGVTGLTLAAGRWLTDLDSERLENITVLGAQAAATLFPIERPLGKTIQAGRLRFTVVGILEMLGREASPGGTPLDQCVFVPITTSRSRFGDVVYREITGSETKTRLELSEIKVKLRTIGEVIPASQIMARLMKLGERAQDDVQMIVPLQLLRQQESTARIFNMVLGSIAIISLLVGGIGIMNVMLATVTERTREIGIRRALGATKVNVITQFLVETAVLSGCGGILGVGLGLLIPYLITALSENLTIILIEHVLLAFCISAGVGISFGVYPAWRAAKMDPVEALRHE